ncbi:ATP-binding protein [Wukongibacter baidiensis]|uniref:ATP-binding protein n=1 Tax=Wukongibacter baidiensis TaxID=1723361 RepID=UPI003D7F4983
MRELSMHILDIAQNSIVAGASVIEIVINENLNEDTLTIIIEDNGKGMSEEEVSKVISPFFTSRTTRKVGLGIPMFKASAEACDGSFKITSEKGKGTYVEAVFKHSHIDRVPIGNMPDTMVVLVSSDINIDFIYKHIINDKEYMLSTKEIKEVLGEVPINGMDVLEWIKGNIIEGIKELK